MFDRIRAWVAKVTRGGTSGGKATDLSNSPLVQQQRQGVDARGTYDPGWQLPTAVDRLPPEQANSFLGPQDPVTPFAPRDVAGRAWDFPLGVNRQIEPRAGEPVTFADLIGLADHCELVRLCIETRKDQMSRLEWAFVPRDDDELAESPKYASRIEKLTTFFRKPDGYHDWHAWMRQLLEQQMVIDAATLFPRRSIGGDLLALDVVDGTTIKLVVDEWGRTPEPPYPAFQQVLKGIPAVNFTRDELIYRPRNKRVNRIYGFSPVEQCLKMANMAIRRELFQLAYYTDGTDPLGFLETPVDWTVQQISDFQKYYDALMADNLAGRRRIKFIPGGAKYTPLKEVVLTDLFDEWIARTICYAFSLPPNAFTKQVNRATAESANEVAQEEGLHPLMLWIEELINFILVEHMNIDDIKFAWNMDQPLDPTDRAKIHEIYVNTGVQTRNEIRDELGFEPMEGADEPSITAGNTVMLLNDVADGKYGPDAQAERDQQTAQMMAQQKQQQGPQQGQQKKPQPGNK